MNAVSLHAGNPGPMTGSGNWTYLVRGPEPVLIDAGVGRDSHLDAVFAHAPSGPAHVIVTHIHPDHASGAPALWRRAPRARFTKFPWADRDADVPVPWQYVADGTDVPSGEGPLRAVHTPGHSPDHLAFVHMASGTAFTGDLLVLGSTVVIPASHGGVLVDYLQSLARMAALGIRRALPSHGPVIDDPLALIDRYVAHRRDREAQVLDALAAGATLVEELVGRIYRGLDPVLVPQAHESVLAHLVKLETDGIVRRVDVGEAWQLRS